MTPTWINSRGYRQKKKLRICQTCGDRAWQRISSAAYVRKICLKCQHKLTVKASAEARIITRHYTRCAHCHTQIPMSPAASAKLKETFCSEACAHAHEHRQFKCLHCGTEKVISRCRSYRDTDKPKWAKKLLRPQKFCSVSCYADWRRTHHGELAADYDQISQPIQKEPTA